MIAAGSDPNNQFAATIMPSALWPTETRPHPLSTMIRLSTRRGADRADSLALLPGLFALACLGLPWLAERPATPRHVYDHHMPVTLIATPRQPDAARRCADVAPAAQVVFASE